MSQRKQTPKQKQRQNKNQKQHTNTNKTLYITAIVLFLAVISAVGIYKFATPAPTEGEKTVTIQIVDDQKQTTTYKVNTDAEYLRQALEGCKGLTFMGTEGPYGLMLQTINGVTANYDKNQAWWSIYVNEELGNYGLDQQPVADGDTFRIEYTTEADLAE